MTTERFIVGASEVSDENFTGMVGIADAVITEIAYGHGRFTAASPNAYAFPAKLTGLSITIKAGTNVPIDFSHIKTTSGTLALLKK